MQVTVNVTYSCAGEVYDHDGAVAMAASLLTQQAATDPGDGYTLVGQIKTAITNTSVDSQKNVTIILNAAGVWAYQLSDAQNQAFARLIAGKSLREAQLLLSNQTGVGKVTIQLSGGNGQLLPTDPAKITIVIQAVSGA
jgi:VCBS repeat-containing protein